MKKLILLTIYLLFTITCKFSNAQISSFPFTQDFESPFTIGINTNFLPNFFGNEVSIANRIFQDNSNFHSGANSCGIIPTSSFDATMTAHLNLTGISNAFVQFYAASASNPIGNRSALLFMSVSNDGGLTYSGKKLIGDSASFPNANTGWNLYQYPIPYTANNHSDVYIKFFVTRGDGTSTTAKLMLDDILFNYSTVDSVLPSVVSVKTLSATTVMVVYSEPVDVTAENISNYVIPTGITSAVRTPGNDTVMLTLATPLILGQWYPLTINNVHDLASNPMSASQTFNVVFNDNVGNVKITEIYYNNPGSDSLSFIEIKNMENHSINISGWYFSSGLGGFVFPENLSIGSNDYLVFAKYNNFVDSFFNIQSVYSGNGSLSNADEKIAISNSNDVLIDSVHYYSTLPWDTTANGYGPSLVLCNENLDNDLASSWTAATTPMGSYANFIVKANPMTNCSLVAEAEELKTSELLSIAIAPNPGGTERILSFNSLTNEDSQITIRDITGRIIQHIPLEKIAGLNRINLRLPALRSGIYLLKVDGGNTIKLIVS